MNFIETPRFPDDIAEGSSGGPGFKTQVFESHGGEEQRTQVWSKLRGRYDVSYGIRDKADMDVVRAFFIDCRGRAKGFRFKDWGDYEAVTEQFGVGDGVEVEFRLTKTYGTADPYVRRIFKPIADTVELFADGVLISGSAYTLNATTGTVTFDVAPLDTVELTWSGEFDVPARFDTDQMSSAHDGWLSENWDSIPIVELKLEDPA